MDDRQARVIQAETGGGFGGKEEYPSIIALHAALLARKAGRPVRMIYDRHEDIAATTKRHPAIVRHRTGLTSDGRLLAQDIEVVMDGGAYCTLTPVVLSRGALHAGGPYRCPERPDPGPGDAHEHAAQRRVPRVRARRRPSSRPRPTSTRSPRRSGSQPLEIRRRNVYHDGDTTPTGQVLRDSVAGEEVLERAAEAAEFVRLRGRNDAERGRRARARARSRARRCGPGANGWPAGSAWRSPGTAPGSPARARSSSPRSPRSS